TNSSTTVQHFRTTPKLLAVLQLGGATCQLFTADQIVLYLGKYIENKKLFNPSNKRVIRCKNDLLGEVFRVNQFTVTDFKDLWKLLFPCLLPATRREVSNSLAQETQPPIEQPSTSNSDGDSELPWWYFISPRRSKEEDSNTGTEVGSYHERETLEAHDSEYESEIDEMIEYEPADSDSEVSDADTEPVTSDEEDVTALHRLKEFQSDEETTTNRCKSGFRHYARRTMDLPGMSHKKLPKSGLLPGMLEVAEGLG
uniref:DM2 domain-containing protein n=1 Tax=Ciona savignyi TaxID=51511 RepID=H2ZPZ7_CIOSA